MLGSDKQHFVRNDHRHCFHCYWWVCPLPRAYQSHCLFQPLNRRSAQAQKCLEGPTSLFDYSPVYYYPSFLRLCCYQSYYYSRECYFGPALWFIWYPHCQILYWFHWHRCIHAEWFPVFTVAVLADYCNFLMLSIQYLPLLEVYPQAWQILSFILGNFYRRPGVNGW